MVWAFIPGPSRCSKFLALLKWSGISVVFFQKNVVEIAARFDGSKRAKLDSLSSKLHHLFLCQDGFSE